MSDRTIEAQSDPGDPDGSGGQNGHGDHGDHPGDARLERRYRTLLRVLPKPYREARGEELLSALMDGSAQGRTRPELREVLSLTRLGLRVRMGGPAGGVEVDPRPGAVARGVALAGAMLLAYVGVTQLALFMGNLLHVPYSGFTWSDPFSVPRGPGHRLDLVPYEVPAGWFFVLALLTAGWWRAARVLALGLFAWSVFLTEGTETILREETVLAGVVTAALFAARGVHTRRAALPGSVALAAVLGVAAWTYTLRNGPVLKALDALQGFGWTDNTHALILAALAVAVVGAVGYRSAVWPVALAVVCAAAFGPVFVRVAALQSVMHSTLHSADVVPMAFLASALMVVAGLALVKERSRRAAG